MSILLRGDRPSDDATGLAVGETFLREIRARVTAEIPPHVQRGDRRLHRKAALIALAFAAAYAAMLGAGSTPVFLVATVAFGLASAGVAFNIFHDANHGSFSRDSRVNLWVARACCTAIGISRHLWCFKHHTLHHHGPNLWRWDDDVESRGLLRMSRREPWQERFRSQHLFALPLYALNSAEWIFAKDFIQLASGRINAHRTSPRLGAGGLVEFWLCKGLYALLFVLPPFMVQPPLCALLGLCIFHLTLSLPITIVFQVAHLNDRVDFPPFDAELAAVPRADATFRCAPPPTSPRAIASRAG